MHKIDSNEAKSINDLEFKVTHIINKSSFVINCDSTLFSAYERNGVAKQIKNKINVEFTPLSQVLDCTESTYFDENLQMLDFCKIENFIWTSLLYKLNSDQLSAHADSMGEDERKSFQKLVAAY